MPSSLMLNTPPQPPSTAAKRQRSRESNDRQLRPATAGQVEVGSNVDNLRHQPSIDIRMPSYLNKTKAEISSAFQELEWQQRYRLAQALNNPSSPFRLDRSPIVVSRNRYANVQPWDAARIKLRTPLDGSDYINASPISLKSRSITLKPQNTASLISRNLSGDVEEKCLNESKYIATQGPKDGQYSHFWQMVMQETSGDVGVIVMLTTCYEGGREKCAQYFPDNMENPTLHLEISNTESGTSRTETVEDGDPFLDPESSDPDTDSNGTGPDRELNGANQESQKQSVDRAEGILELLSIAKDTSIGCDVRKIKLTIGDSTKIIYHYLYHDWADFGRPEIEDRLRLLQLTRVSRKVAGESPRIVHCSAGVGRTGTWIALDFLLRELEEGRFVSSSYFTSKSLDVDFTHSSWGKSGPPKASTPEAKDNDLIFETVSSLREQRMMMVMNELQYSFLYEALKEAFMDKYAEKETGPVIREEPSSKVRRTSQLLDAEGKLAQTTKTQGDDDGALSEAETEIMEHDKTETKPEDQTPSNADPYAAVAPDVIRGGIEKKDDDETT